MTEPDFTGEPPDYYWSELDPAALLADLQELFDRSHRIGGGTITRAWTDEDEGPAFAELEDGRVYRFTGDGTVTAIERVDPATLSVAP